MTDKVDKIEAWVHKTYEEVQCSATPSALCIISKFKERCLWLIKELRATQCELQQVRERLHSCERKHELLLKMGIRKKGDL